MKKIALILMLFGGGLWLHAQPLRVPHDKFFTGRFVHQHFGPPRELLIFNRSWGTLMDTYFITATFSNRLSSIMSFDYTSNDPEVLLTKYYEKIDELNRNFIVQQNINNANIDASIRGLGEFAANVARNNNITTKSALGDFLIKEIVIGTAQERAKQKNEQNLEMQRRQLQETLEENLSTQMYDLKEQMLSENIEKRDQYFEAMAYEADFSKEAYYIKCYEYYNCFTKQIISEYSYKSESWYKPRCLSPRIEYSTSIGIRDYAEIADRKFELYHKYNNDVFLQATNIFLDASLAENKKNPRAYYLKAQIEKDIVDKMFFSTVAINLEPGNANYKNLNNEVSDAFNDSFFMAIRNEDIGFISRSIEYGFHLGREQDGKSSLEMAIELDKPVIVEMFINSIPDGKKNISTDGSILLFHACAVDALEVVKKLISIGVNPEYRDKNNSGLTALNVAIENNSQKVIPFLVSTYSIKPALLYAKNTGSDYLKGFSFMVYKSDPEKLKDIRTVYTKFNPETATGDYFIDYRGKLTDENRYESPINSTITADKTPEINGIEANKTEAINYESSKNVIERSEPLEEQVFDSESGTFIDFRDRNRYDWVKINNQIWMADNLAYVPDDEEGIWIYQMTNIADDKIQSTTNYKEYGVLYNYKTALKSCPEGWRVPSDLDWSKLEHFLDNTIIDFNQISYRGTTIGNILTKSKQGSFNAKYGGKKTSGGNFIGLETIGSYWTSSQADQQKIWSRQIQKNIPQIIRSLGNEDDGYSIRCIRDFH
jgi:uncharacterized protein (TIGR02145 family)